jgi:hypothetical protein
LNLECDGLAKSFWNANAFANSWMPNLQFGLEKWCLWTAQQKVDKKKLCPFTFLERTTKRWHRKHSLTPKLITSIDWDACKAAMMGRLPFGCKQWLIKHATCFCGVDAANSSEAPRTTRNAHAAALLKAPATQLNAKAQEPTPPLPLLFRN